MKIICDNVLDEMLIFKQKEARLPWLIFSYVKILIIKFC